MRVKSLLILTIVTCFLLADDGPQGIPAKPSASDYAAKAEFQKATFAASLVPSKQVEHLFAFDISKSFVVFEVACYADSNAAIKISREAFVVKDIHSSEPETVASTIERQNQPPMPSSLPMALETSATVGVAHGPNGTGGVYTGGSVTAETNGRHDGGYPGGYPHDPKPGGTSEDRRMLAAQLKVRSIPEGPVNHPVAGYVYFRKSDVKAQGGNYELQYLADDEGTGGTHAVKLTVPAKSH